LSLFYSTDRNFGAYGPYYLNSLKEHLKLIEPFSSEQDNEKYIHLVRFIFFLLNLISKYSSPVFTTLRILLLLILGVLYFPEKYNSKLPFTSDNVNFKGKVLFYFL